MVTRRDWMRLSSCATVGGWSALAGVGCGSESAPRILPAPGPDHDSIVHGSRVELNDAPLELIAGAVPGDMLGFVFIVGGVPYADGTPLFTGDGMVTRLRFDGAARVKTRLLRTDDYLLDHAATGTLAFANRGMLRFSPQLGARDFVNTALVPSPQGRLLATYDAGRPWEIDPETLDVVTPVGAKSTWRPMIPGLSPGLDFLPIHMSSAHPVWDPDGSAYLVNWAPAFEGLEIETFLRVMTWDGESEPTATSIVDERGAPVVIDQSLHQIQTTDRFLILNDGSFLIEPAQMIGMDVTEPQRPTTVLWVIPKAELGGETATAVRVEIEGESAHFLAERDDADDRITLAIMHTHSSDPSEWVREGDIAYHSGATVPREKVGMMVAPADHAPHGRYVIDAKSGALLESRLLEDERLLASALWSRDERDVAAPIANSYWMTLGFDPDLLTTRIADAYRDQPSRRVRLDEMPTVAVPAQLLHLDHTSASVLDALELPAGWLPMSPTFVPRLNGAAGDGYLVTLMLGPDGDEVWIFDAADLGHGPLARLRHPDLDVGFSLHTCWLEELRAAGSYRVDREAEYSEDLRALRDDAQALVREVLGVS